MFNLDLEDSENLTLQTGSLYINPVQAGSLCINPVQAGSLDEKDQHTKLMVDLYFILKKEKEEEINEKCELF